MNSRLTRIIIECVVWTAFIIFPLILFPTLQPFISKGLLNPALKGIIITHTLLIAFYYFNYYYALPKFYFAKKYPQYFFLIGLCLLSLILILQTDPHYNPLPSPPFRFATLAFIFSIVVRFVMMLLLSLGISNYQRLKQAEQEKLKSELAFLKAQINPHFLFNTLNSIYALAVKKSDSTAESITRLASIMRYVINEAATDMVPLAKELNYVSSYIELENLRLTSKVKLNYTVTGDTSGKQISPMIFIPLIENAFKHGVSTSENSEIDIAINTHNHTLTLLVKNTKVRPDKNNSNGLGIENVKKRLHLLYPGKHDLSISDTEKEFSANLVLLLND